MTVPWAAWMLCDLTLCCIDSLAQAHRGWLPPAPAIPQGESTLRWVIPVVSEWFSVHRIIYFWCQGGPGRLFPLAVNALNTIDSSAPIHGNLLEQQVCVCDF